MKVPEVQDVAEEDPLREVEERRGEAGFVAGVSLMLGLFALSIAGLLWSEGSVLGCLLAAVCTSGAAWLFGTAIGYARRWQQLDDEAVRLLMQRD